MSAPTRTSAPPAAQVRPRVPRAALVMLLIMAAVGLLMAALPPLIPPTFPALHTPGWYAIAATAGGLAALVSRLPAANRGLVLGLGWLLVVLTGGHAFVIGDLVSMFGTWLVVPAVALLAGQVRTKARKALLAAHVVSSASWVGVGLTVVGLSVVAMTTDDIQVAAVTYQVMALFDLTLLPWTNFTACLTGLAIGITTNWGLLRYYWVATKLAIAVGILVLAFALQHDALVSAATQAARLAATGGSTAQLGGVTTVVFGGFLTALLGLVVALLLSLYKPGGKTRRGRRRLPDRRAGQPELPVTLGEVRAIADGTLALTLRASNGVQLPAWEPGAHIDLVLPSGLVRQYSLYGDPADTSSYRIAVLLEPDGRGGSAEIHRLTSGANLRIRGPRNNFPLINAPQYVFIAGGIGITPFLPMIHRLAASDVDWRLIYRGKSLSTMAFAVALAKQYPSRVSLLPADTCARPELSELLTSTTDGVAVYCCGPENLLDAVESAMAVHCAHGTLHVERFAASDRAAEQQNKKFVAELRRSGVVLTVPAEQTLLCAIQQVHPGVDMSCSDGICGSCETKVISGVPEHRDDVLQPAERGRTDVIYPCVSRARGKRIVLDL